MKLILKETVVCRILKELAEARKNLRTVDAIVVTEQEYAEMCSDLRFERYRESTFKATYWVQDSCAMEPINLNHREFKLRDSHRGGRGYDPYRKYASSLLFHGVPVFVVQEAYMPV